MSFRVPALLFSFAVFQPLLVPRAGEPPSQPEWRVLQPGVEYTQLKLEAPAYLSAKDLHVVRIDPRVAKLRAVLASESDGRKRTARQWAEEQGLSVVVNLGMFNVDRQTVHTGFLRRGEHVNSSRWLKTYQSVLAFGPTQDQAPAAVIVDLDTPGAQDQIKGFHTVVQNLRLIKGARQNVWGDNPRKWSEALLASDDDGRLLLVFSRTPFPMRELNRLLIASPLRIQRAMHLEGGPEASLSIHAGGLDLDLCGSFESGFWENESNSLQWPVPNVLGVERASPVSAPAAPSPGAPPPRP
jgi:hypothetical protein